MWNFIVIFEFKCSVSVSVTGSGDCALHQGPQWKYVYSKLYCVILDELSVFTTLFFLSNKKKERKKES